MYTAQGQRFGELLRAYRRAAALSQDALAEQAGISTRAISDLERGIRATPRLDTVRQLAVALALTPDERSRLIEAATRSASRSIPTPAITASQTTHSARLPVPLTPLLGRERDEAAVAGLLRTERVRLVTL